MSLVTGSVRTLGVNERLTTGTDGRLQQRDQILTVANTAGMTLLKSELQVCLLNTLFVSIHNMLIFYTVNM